MNNLLTSIATKISGSALSVSLGGRIYLDQYPADEMPPTYPYIVYFIVSAVPEKTFSEEFETILLQFSLFSASPGAAEITTMYNDLKALFDECAFSITNNTLVWMKRQNLTPMTDDITVSDATQTIKHWAVDYEIMTEAT